MAGTTWAQLLLLLVLAGWSSGFLWLRRQRSKAVPNSACVVVLGDIGRSPRMMYHAQSLAQTGHKVYLLGYSGSPVLPALEASDAVAIVHIPQPPAWLSKLPRALFLLLAPLKLLHGALALAWALLFALPSFPQVLLVQTPPALPTLPVVRLASFLQGSSLVIDWHNTSYSILAMRLGKNSIPTKIAKALEGFCGRHATAHFFVTEAMKKELSASWDLSGDRLAFHDRPQASSRRLNVQETHALLQRISVLQDPALKAFLGVKQEGDTGFTVPTSDGSVEPKAGRPALLVSSTSWTADEDFSILLRALNVYEKKARMAEGGLPRVMVLITGKGALKAEFERSVARLEQGWAYVRCRTAWLESSDYPKLLGAADLGISLHSSSSGIDLPMKVVDMFGSGLPVLALDFACIGELVQDEINGRVFRDAAELADQLEALLKGFPKSSSTIDSLREGVTATQSIRWQEAWEKTVLPVIKECTVRRKTA